MSSIIDNATDVRQTKEWSEYLKKLGWEIVNIKGTFVFIRQVKPFRHSLIKIAHSKQPYPFDEIEKLAIQHHALFVRNKVNRKFGLL